MTACYTVVQTWCSTNMSWSHHLQRAEQSLQPPSSVSTFFINRSWLCWFSGEFALVTLNLLLGWAFDLKTHDTLVFVKFYFIVGLFSCSSTIVSIINCNLWYTMAEILTVEFTPIYIYIRWEADLPCIYHLSLKPFRDSSKILESIVRHY